MLHILGFTHDGQEGISVLQYAADSLGVALSAQDYGQAFFQNSAQPSGILSHPKTLSQPAQERLRQDWKARFGQQGTQQDIAVLEEGMAFTPITIPNNQAQFLETRQFQVREICRWFRMPPSKVADLQDAHYSNMEQMALEYIQDTILSWLVRWEQAMKMRLFGVSSVFFAEHNVMGLLRGDSQARARFYKELFGLGSLTPNEIRGLENFNPVGTEGDEVFVAANNYRTLKSAIQMSTQPMPLTTGRNGMPTPVPARNGSTHDDDDAPEDAEEDD
jgi:HK97 family phage portal protein